MPGFLVLSFPSDGNLDGHLAGPSTSSLSGNGETQALCAAWGGEHLAAWWVPALLAGRVCLMSPGSPFACADDRLIVPKCQPPEREPRPTLRQGAGQVNGGGTGSKHHLISRFSRRPKRPMRRESETLSRQLFFRQFSGMVRCQRCATGARFPKPRQRKPSSSVPMRAVWSEAEGCWEFLTAR